MPESLPAPSGSTIECARCRGRGATCTECDRAMECGHEYMTQVYACHMCEGTGQVCATCEGEQVVARGFAIDAPGRPDIVPCPACRRVCGLCRKPLDPGSTAYYCNPCWANGGD